MKISYEEFSTLAWDYNGLKEKNDEYLKEIPNDIKAFIFDNTFSNNILKQSNLCLELLLGVRLYEDYMWFLYDSTKSYEEDDDEPNVIIDGRKYYIHCLATYLNYVKLEYFNNKD